jgi:WD40 repeat protein
LFTSVRLYHHNTTDPATVLTLKIQGEAPEAPRRHRADLPWEIETILEGGLQTEPGDRYPSAAALAEDLRRFLADEPILYRRPSLRRRATLFARRNRAIVRLSAVFLGLAFLGAFGFAVALSVERANTKAQSKIASEQKRIASEKTKIASEQKRIASEMTVFAGEKEKLALQKQKEARASEFLKRREVYSADMQTALRAWDANKPGDVRALLDKHDPRLSKAAEDLRGFEWYYLHHLLSGSMLSLEVDGKARAVCFAPDGKRLAAIVDKPAGLRTTTGFRIKLWKLPGGELERTILIGRGTGLMEPEPLRLLKQNLLGEQSVAFSPDGKLVAGTCMIVRPQQRDGVVKVWEADTGREVFSRNDDAIGGRAVEFSPDGRYLLVGGYKNSVLVWELDGGNLRWSLSALDLTDFRNKGEPEIPRPGVSAFDAVPVVSLRFSRDGKYLLRSSDRLTRSAWPPKEGGPPFQTHGVDEDAIASSYLKNEHVITLVFKSRDWDLAVAPDVSPNAIQLLTTRLIIHPQLNEMRHPGQPRFEGSQVATLSLDSGPIQRLAFGEPFYLAMNSRDGLVTVGVIDNSRTWNGRFRLRGYEGEISSLAFSPNGRNLAAAGQERVTVWETRGRPELRPLLEALSARASAPRSNPGRTGINTQQGVMLADNRWVVSLVTAVTPNEKTLSYDRSHRIMVMDPTHPEAPPTWFDPPIPGVVTVAVSPDRSLCAVWGTGDIFKQSRPRGPAPVQPDRAIVSPMYILEAAEGQPTLTRHILPRNGLSMMFSPDGRRLVSAAPVEGVVRLWDVVTGKEIRNYPVRANRVEFNADGRWIVSGNPAEINLLNPEGGDVVQKFLIDLRQPVWAFRPDGLRLAFAAQGGRIRVWDLEKNQQERDFSAQGKVIEALAYDPEGARLLTYSESRDSGHDITIWSLESGEDIFTIPSAELPVDQFLHFAAVMAQVERRWKAEAEAR